MAPTTETETHPGVYRDLIGHIDERSPAEVPLGASPDAPDAPDAPSSIVVDPVP